MTKVQNMQSESGKEVPNQFIITDGKYKTFQSYKSIIAIIETTKHGDEYITLDGNWWKYSPTTSKYRNQFLGETTKETQAKIDSGKYKLSNLN